jgi:hypothetical protein
MTSRKILILGLCAILSAPAARAQTGRGLSDSARIARRIPATSADHPGNIFLAGEPVTIRVPPEATGPAVDWRAVDDANEVVGQGSMNDAAAGLGILGVGWYRVEFLDATGAVTARTTAGVLARLGAATPQDSPICVDSATSWFARSDVAGQEGFAYLAALAGVNWIRDRLSWGDVQTGPETFAPETTYDSAATIQAKYGLKVLQVFHATPRWAIDRDLDGGRATQRFPRDLRHLYRFCQAMARRYEGRVLAWEPWNEANIANFGGHTIDEMCTHQKAAYLAFKAGRPDLTVCWNVYAGSGTPLHTQGVFENEVWRYFDTYNIHTYSQPDAYLSQFAPARQAACGRPLWLTECGIGLHWQTERPWSELSPTDERRQAEFIAPSYASSLFAGVSRHFFFILGNYPENRNQFGILRHDQTPRPAYLALAAVGHLLAGARPMGRLLPQESPEVRIYAFRAVPDGVESDVLVAWANQPTNISWPQGLSPRQVYDYLGRSLAPALPAGLTPSAIFVVLPKGEAEMLKLERPPDLSLSRGEGVPPLSRGQDAGDTRGQDALATICPVVLQLQMPAPTIDLKQQAHLVPAGTPVDLALFAYNFSDSKVSGTVAAQTPAGWETTPANWTIDLDPMERKPLPARILIPSAQTGAEWIRWNGDFGTAGRPVLAVRLAVQGSQKPPPE